MNRFFNLTPPALLPAPFPHFAVREFLLPDMAETLLTWFESSADWNRHFEDGFYDTYEIDMQHIDLPPSLMPLLGDETLTALRRYFETAFGIRLNDKVDVMGHKLQVGQVIRVHSDYGPVGQTHRLVIQLNRHWTVANGGILMMFDSEEPDENSTASRYYLPASRSAYGFEISPYSYHAVSPIVRGDRYTLVYSFYDVNGYQKFETLLPAMADEAVS